MSAAISYINHIGGTAISYINHIGGTKSARCNDIAREIWNWVLGKGIWISANYIPGKENTEANQMSRTRPYRMDAV